MSVSRCVASLIRFAVGERNFQSVRHAPLLTVASSPTRITGLSLRHIIFDTLRACRLHNLGDLDKAIAKKHLHLTIFFSPFTKYADPGLLNKPIGQRRQNHDHYKIHGRQNIHDYHAAID